MKTYVVRVSTQGGRDGHGMFTMTRGDGVVGIQIGISQNTPGGWFPGISSYGIEWDEDCKLRTTGGAKAFAVLSDGRGFNVDGDAKEVVFWSMEAEKAYRKKITTEGILLYSA